jgi:hypothetical protein
VTGDVATAQQLAPPPGPFRDHAAALAGDTLVGFLPFGAASMVARYSIPSNTWSVAGLIGPQFGGAASATTTNSRGEPVLYFFGGYDYYSGQPTNRVTEYNLVTGEKKQGTGMPMPLVYSRAATLSSSPTQWQALLFGGWAVPGGLTNVTLLFTLHLAAPAPRLDIALQGPGQALLTVSSLDPASRYVLEMRESLAPLA